MMLRTSLYSNRLFSEVACLLSRINTPMFNKEIERRRKYSLFDYIDLGKPLPKHYDEICTDNNCFGIGFSIRQYAGYHKSYINGWIEHGYFYADSVSDLSAISFTNNILTFGNHRESIINKHLPHKSCFKIGPYIHYAEDYVNEDDLFRIKENLGRVLLVFPVHSGTGVKAQYEKDYLFSLVESIKMEYDTVLFSLFWSDLDDEYVEEIKKRGYKIVCSGHRYDPYFLCRQKTIIKLADVTMSNGIGTNLVYCTYYKKPHWLIKQESTFDFKKIGQKHSAFLNKNINNYSLTPLLYEAFKDYSDTLSEEQHDLCSDLFGFRFIKTREEMLTLLKGLK